jgi:hypothetical protein
VKNRREREHNPGVCNSHIIMETKEMLMERSEMGVGGVSPSNL